MFLVKGKKYNAQVRCHSCDSDKSKYIACIGGHDYFICVVCGLIFSDNLSEESFDAMYKHKNETEQELIERFQSKLIVSSKRARYLFGHVTANLNLKVLDVGCGEGSFLFALKEYGIDAYGVESNMIQARYGIAKHQLNILNSYYDKASFERSTFDVITFNRVLEHIPDVHKTLETARYHLKDGGFLFIDVPTYWNKNKVFMKNQWGGGHLRLYDINSLKYLLVERHSFELIHAIPFVDFYGNYKPGCACLVKNKTVRKDSDRLVKKISPFKAFRIKLSIFLGNPVLRVKKILIKLLPQHIIERLKKLR
ncbi:MAG: class I SAM-dependent methyltransferase [Nitrospirae bacterium]|nr:class I SAM-dependent methyltransferase [Nitrospirota bacterium]